ncbi:MAG: hypothetical protein SAK29_41455 [Scytonema sp. PMC 1069.18]|nr:hypothetical protein [Scytonema sp. PMC 1069.18]MEC4884874.1 hypothetical protein [Scytonema sp. PMC 1070.18]
MEESITVEEAIELLFNRESIQAAIIAEDEANCDVSAGLDWSGHKIVAAFLKNPALLGRMTILRLSLNREIDQMLQTWNLGIGLEAAINVAHARLLSRLQLPSSTAIRLLETILMRDELYKQELIGDRQVLGDLLRVLLLDSDWDEIATAAGNAVRSQVIEKVSA